LLSKEKNQITSSYSEGTYRIRRGTGLVSIMTRITFSSFAAILLLSCAVAADTASTTESDRKGTSSLQKKRESHLFNSDRLSSADILGINFAIGKRGFVALSNVVSSLASEVIDSVSVEDVESDISGFICSLSNIEIRDADLESFSAGISDDSTIDLGVRNISATLTAEWSAKPKIWPHLPHFKGSVKLELSRDSYFLANLNATAVPRTRTNVHVSSCDSDIIIKSVHFSGGISDELLNLFKEHLREVIGPSLNRAACSALSDVLETSNVLDYVICGVDVGDTFLSCQANIDYGMGNGTYDRNGFPVSMPLGQPLMNDRDQLGEHDAELIMDISSINYLLLSLLYDMELFDQYLTQSVVGHFDKDVATMVLNTSFFKATAPSMYEKWPNTEMQVEFNATRYPTLVNAVVDSNDDSESPIVLLNLTMDAAILDFQVRESFGGLSTAFRFGGSLDLTARLATEFVKDSETQILVVDFPSISNCSRTFDLLHSSVGDVDAEAVSIMMGWTCEYLREMLNDAVRKVNVSLSVPIGPVVFRNVSIESRNVETRSSRDDVNETLEALVLLLDVLPSNVSSEFDLLSSSDGVASAVENLRSLVVRAASEEPRTLSRASSSRKVRRLRRRGDARNRFDRASLYVPQTSPYGASVSKLREGDMIDITLPPFSAVPNDPEMYMHNADALSNALNSAGDGDTVWVPPDMVFYMNGGIEASDRTNVRLIVDGILRAVPDFDVWPQSSPTSTQLAAFIQLTNFSGLTITSETRHGIQTLIDGGPGNLSSSTSGGLIDGQGKRWWNEFTIGASLSGSHRPKLLQVSESENVLVENIFMLNSPSFHLLLDDVLHVEVRDVTVYVDRYVSDELSASEIPSLRSGWDRKSHLQPESLNTDGIDPSGRDVWIHRCVVVNNDDSIAVKPSHGGKVYSDCSQDMLIEDSLFTGFGASIGSVPPHESHNCVRNITFRNISMPQTGKGIYVKSNPSCDDAGQKTAEITNLLFEDFEIDHPLWWPIWIGPQQQSEPDWTPEQRKNDCSLAYPLVENCPTQACVSFTNITLRRINIVNPVLSPGVILGNASNPMTGIIFDDVKVQRPGTLPFTSGYKCEHAYGNTTEGTSPKPEFLRVE